MKKRYTIAFIIFVCALCALFLWNVGVGSVNMSLGDFFAMFGKDGSDSTLYQIIWKIRLPRITAAILLGGALSVSGFLLQSFFQNPIAGPYVLGISSGAKLVVAMTMIICLQRGVALNSAGMVIAAFTGSLIAMGFVLLISFRVSKMSLLVVCGIMIGYICSAITDFCVTFADDSNIVNLHGWSQGSFSGMSWSNVKVAAVIIAVAVVLTFMLSKPIGAYQLGEAYAQSMGVNIKVFRVTLILLSSILPYSLNLLKYKILCHNKIFLSIYILFFYVLQILLLLLSLHIYKKILLHSVYILIFVKNQILVLSYIPPSM